MSVSALSEDPTAIDRYQTLATPLGNVVLRCVPCDRLDMPEAWKQFEYLAARDQLAWMADHERRFHRVPDHRTMEERAAALDRARERVAAAHGAGEWCGLAACKTCRDVGRTPVEFDPSGTLVLGVAVI